MTDLKGLLNRRRVTQAQLSQALGSRSRASELMTGKRLLTKEQIVILNGAFGISVKALFAAAVKPPMKDAQPVRDPSR